jgi:hypothetical protein
MSSNNFKALVEIDGADIEQVNRYLRRLKTETASKALKRGIRNWTNLGKKTAKALAPVGPNRPTEKVRGTERPNPHIKDFVFTKVKGYSKGQIIWGSIGVKEIKGSYATPHWYLRWVEFGHAIKRRSTEAEAILLKSRGATKAEYSKITIGQVRGTFFLTKALASISPRLLPIMQESIAKELAQETR